MALAVMGHQFEWSEKQQIALAVALGHENDG